MCRLLETIKIKGGAIHNPALHNERANRARLELWGRRDALDLGAAIDLSALSGAPGVFKCRVLFRERVEAVEFHPYAPPRIKSLKLVTADRIDYRYKFEDRSALAALLGSKGACDEILIVKDGLITDTSFSNVVLWDGKNYLTPARPLLEGTKRRALLERGVIRTEEIKPRDLPAFKKLYLINSLIDLEDGAAVAVKDVFPE